VEADPAAKGNTTCIKGHYGMLVLRKEQLEALAQAPQKSFENSMLGFIQQHFPKHYELLGDGGARRVAQLGGERSREYRLETGRDVSLYISLMIMLGSDFDTDCQLPWASEILGDKSIINQSYRIEQLYGAAMSYLDRVVGARNEYIQPVLLKIKSSSVEELVGQADADFENHIAGRLRDIYPQKFEAVGENPIRELIQQGSTIAQNCGITNTPGRSVIVLLMFMLGSGFHHDPLYPWASRVLSDLQITDQKAKTELLARQAKGYLDEWLK
jgi:hypothetical protein